jgi:hypothetical protein
MATRAHTVEADELAERGSAAILRRKRERERREDPERGVAALQGSR